MATSKESKVLTDNPLLDEIVWNAKMLARGVVLKDTEEAEKHETLETVQNGDLLIAVTDHIVGFDSFIYDETIFRKLPSINEKQIRDWTLDNSLVPNELRPILAKFASDMFLENYVEKNNYYRRLHGDPDYDPTGEWQGLWIDVNTILEDSAYPEISIRKIEDEGTDYQLIHKLSIGYTEMLHENGTIERITESTDVAETFGLEQSQLMYLKRIGSKSISYYTARKAERFEMLYCPTADAVEVETRFKELLEANRRVVLYTTYSEAYKFKSVYYDRFMMIMIIIQTIVDMIVELPEYLIRRDIFDIRTCAYIFESNGVEFFPDIPVKYQVALVKNLNKLIKFKSTDKCMVDICSVFGCDSIEIFKYYILKDRKVMSATNPKYYNEQRTYLDAADGEFHQELDNNKNFDIKFVKVPILESYDSYIRSNKNIYDYESITGGDNYWIGDKQRDRVLEEIKALDFTLLRSKYYSIEAMIDTTKRTFQLVYFTNILLYNDIDKSKLVVSLPNISNKKQFELVDTIITLYALSYIYYGVEDDIIAKQEDALKIYGFNFKADLTEIGEYLYNEFGTTWSELFEGQFAIPDGHILTYNELAYIFTTNKNIYDHIRDVLIHPPNKRMYDIYKYLHNSLMVTDWNMEYYKLPNGELAHTYTDFLLYKEPLLGAYLAEIKAIPNPDNRQEKCVNAIQSITTYLRDYIDYDFLDLNYIFSNLPSISMDFIKHYIQEVIDFFKSFKIFTHDMAITYLFQDKYQNTVVIVDWILLNIYFEKFDVVKIEDWLTKNGVDVTYDQKVELIDKVWLYIDHWITKYYDEHYDTNNLREVIKDNKILNTFFDIHELGFEESIVDKLYQMIITFAFKDKIPISDEIARKMLILDKEEFMNEQILDVMYLWIDQEIHEAVIPDDKIHELKVSMEYAVRQVSEKKDGIAKSNVTMNPYTVYQPMDNYFLIYTKDDRN